MLRGFSGTKLFRTKPRKITYEFFYKNFSPGKTVYVFVRVIARQFGGKSDRDHVTSDVSAGSKD